MCPIDPDHVPSPAPAGRNWDGSRPGHRTHRALRLHPDTRTRLLRAAQSRPCALCGNRVEWHYRADGRPVPLHPHELPVALVPTDLRWHLADGIAHPLADGTPWCRVAHPPLCPATEPPPTARLGRLAALRRHLGVSTRRLIDAGQFTPRPADPPVPPPTAGTPARRDVVCLLHALYLAPGPVAQTPCVSATVRRTRCPNTLTHQAKDTGQWAIVPVPSGRPRSHRRELTDHLTGTPMAVYDLTHLPYASQLRWRAQRCPVHADSPAADIALTGWEPFDAFAHHQHITTTVPTSDPGPGERPC